jgi:thiamine pyrophosphate-dependent acetolactate synthase large subunit-like protein
MTQEQWGLGVSRLGILAGPGVVEAGCVEGLRAFAHRVGCGVVNTWGAKGVFRWDDPLHFGTAGLQARDFELAGLGDVDVLVTTGLDPDEVTSTPWEGRAEVIDVPPADLATYERWLPPGTTERPELYTALAAVVGPMYEQPGSPPARAAALAASLPDDGIVVAAPGLVGFWIARTFPTSRPGSVRITRDEGPGAAVVRVHDDDWADVDLDPSALVAVAGAIVAWGGVG